jgi:hypothetical protein
VSDQAKCIDTSSPVGAAPAVSKFLFPTHPSPQNALQQLAQHRSRLWIVRLVQDGAHSCRFRFDWQTSSHVSVLAEHRATAQSSARLRSSVKLAAPLLRAVVFPQPASLLNGSYQRPCASTPAEVLHARNSDEWLFTRIVRQEQSELRQQLHTRAGRCGLS